MDGGVVGSKRPQTLNSLAPMPDTPHLRDGRCKFSA